MTEKAKKTIAYIRVSSQRQVDEGVSVASQKRIITQLAGFKELKIEADDFLIEKGVSAGIPLWERPKGRVLKRKLLSGEYDNLIVMKIDRLFRITSDLLFTIEELDDMGINLLVADLGGEAIDTSTTMGKFMLTLFGAIAEMERGLISERTQEGMEQLYSSSTRISHSRKWRRVVKGIIETITLPALTDSSSSQEICFILKCCTETLVMLQTLRLGSP